MNDLNDIDPFILRHLVIGNYEFSLNRIILTGIAQGKHNSVSIETTLNKLEKLLKKLDS